MKRRYSDIDRDSGVESYEIQDTSITVWFKGNNRPYSYSHRKAGMQHVNRMKRLAQAGDGLNEYINDHVKKLYD
tara:strand:+ start:596 stop:817 length:222 start_codon:yes stop_codon:yes gene_type:complete